jgi:vancomycin resistance protein VanJ
VVTTRKQAWAVRPANRRRRVRLRDVLLALLAVLLAAVMVGHLMVPDVAGLGTALDSFLPWLGLLVVPLALVALAARSRLGVVAVLVPVLVWLGMFGPLLVPRGGGTAQLRVVTQNLAAANPDPAATAAELVRTGADLVAVEEMSDSRPVARVLDRTYRYHVSVGTVGLWSRYRIAGSAPVDLGLGWTRALRAEVETDWGPLAVYAVHLASVRPGVDGERDRTMTRLAAAVKADTAHHVLLAGDLNTASTDRQLRKLVPPLHDAQRDAGSGFGFTWPSAFPLTRPDQLLYRGLTATDAGVVHTTGSDHRAAAAGFRLT